MKTQKQVRDQLRLVDVQLLDVRALMGKAITEKQWKEADLLRQQDIQLSNQACALCWVLRDEN